MTMQSPSSNLNVTENNRKLFGLFHKKLAQDDPVIYTTFAGKFAAWLSDERAYYPEARPEILKILLIAQTTLWRNVGMDTNLNTSFHISSCIENPMVAPYSQLLRAIHPYREHFTEPNLQAQIKVLLKTITAPGPLKNPSNDLSVDSRISLPPIPPEPTLAFRMGSSASHIHRQPAITQSQPPPPHATLSQSDSGSDPVTSHDVPIPSSLSVPLISSPLNLDHLSPCTVPATSTPALTPGEPASLRKPKRKRKKLEFGLDALIQADIEELQKRGPIIKQEPVEDVSLLERSTRGNSVRTQPEVIVVENDLVHASSHLDVLPDPEVHRIVKPVSGTVTVEAVDQSPSLEVSPQVDSLSPVLNQNLLWNFLQLSMPIDKMEVATTMALGVAGRDLSPTALHDAHDHKLYPTGASEIIFTEDIVDDVNPYSQTQSTGPPISMDAKIAPDNIRGPHTPEEKGILVTKESEIFPTSESIIPGNVLCSEPGRELEAHVQGEINAIEIKRPTTSPIVQGGSAHDAPTNMLTIGLNADSFSEGIPTEQLQVPLAPRILLHDLAHHPEELDPESSKVGSPDATPLPNDSHADGGSSLQSSIEFISTSKSLPDLASQPGSEQTYIKPTRNSTNLVESDPSITLLSITEDEKALHAFGTEMRVLARQKGLAKKSTIRMAFDIDMEHYTALSLWCTRKHHIKDLGKSLCISLSCYPMVTPEGGTKTLEQISALPSTWPTERGISMNVMFGGRLTNFPLSPPLGFSPNGLVDLSEFLSLGPNSIEIVQPFDMSDHVFILRIHYPTRAQLHQAAQRRQKKQDWKDWLLKMSQPLDIPIPAFS